MKSILLAAAFLGSLCWAGTNPYNIIPEPVNVTTTSGTTKNLKIVHEQKVAGLGNEGYAMKLTPGGVELRYTTPNGKAMAMATLFQLQDQLSDTPEGLPCGSIQDSPDFGWRGMMVDVGRYHYPMKEIYNFVDAMHYYKYNVLHLHLTEDQGWRLPVPGYDKLRTIGAVRPSAPESQNNSLLANEGMYTKKELQDLVAYCKARGIQVLPEVEMPGHNMALAASYPEFCCNTKRAQVWTHGGVSSKLICPQQPAHKNFLNENFNTGQHIIPFPYIHIGGDEAPRTRWKKCPKCQARIRTEKLKADKNHTAEDRLQSYCMTRIEKLLNSKGRQIIGWDEILEGDVAPNATVMSWRGSAGGIKAAQLGHDVIMTPNDYCYFDYYQSEDTRHEPFAIGGFVPLEKVYSLNPTASLTEEQAKHILGAQANLWTEYIPTSEQVEYMVLPRMAALAEVQWTQQEKKDYTNFTTRLAGLISLYRRDGLNYREPFRQQADSTATEKK